ncbi:hypothetical protein IHE44_0010137 [Lamprotornis superbus]|uniref:Uncharacterized protein n=1 Tax=Lamprotornis superbus TaxID=245042 RepID=A0A835NDL4_9PASS|nr:hypothetical protein IHE44_0010137 [Lamprotornis superbus]
MGLWKVVAAVTLVVAVVVVAVTVPTLLCHSCGGQDRNSTAELQKALDVTNRSLAVSRGRWQRCMEELEELRGQGLELERALADVTRLEEQNRALGTEMTRQREQLEEEQSLRAQLQMQIRLLREQLQDVRSQRSTGDRPAVSPGVPMLLLLGMLLL